MIGKTILHYKILEKLGEGGMGVVYKAEDTKLKRDVAIKFLPRQIAANEEERERFKIEAQAAAALNHPNIATIHAIEDSNDPVAAGREMFIVMEYIEGLELRDVIKIPPIPPSEKGGIVSPFEGGARRAGDVLPIDDTINYATQIAEGLQAAHRKGIVHRDIKSSNIMITNEGKVKIMDFGLARIGAGIQLTKEHSTLGTAAYMSPEQASGKTIDHRTDIWSMGVILYEMLTGNHPFKGEYEQAVIYSILNEEPQNMQTLRSDIPNKVIGVVDKMLAKNPDQRFRNMEEILAAFRDIEKTLKTTATDQKEELSSIAVLPFADMSPARDQDYFCEGVAEEILNSINKIEGLRVASRTSSFQFKGSNLDVREIGNRLNVSAVLEGSVRKAGNLLRINVQLTSVADGFYLWSERYDRELEDVFAIQEDIAENVAVALRGVLTPKEKEAIRRPETTIEAYENFLKGRQLLHQLAYAESREMFQEAVKQDPTYAPAYAGLSDVYSGLYEWMGTNRQDLEAADRTSRKALSLAPNLAESHSSRGYVFSLYKKYDEAEKEFQEAIRLNPKSYDAYYFWGRSCFARGEIEKSAELFRNAAEVRLEDFQSMLLSGQSLHILGRNQEAENALREGIRRAERQLELDPTDRRALSLTAGSLFEIGEKERAFEWVDKALKLYPEDVGVLLNGACLKARAGMKEEALDLLEKVLGKGFGKRDWIEHDPDYDSLRDDPRFQAMLNKLK